MQKRSKDRPILTTIPVVLVGLAAVSVFGWMFGREPSYQELSYGQIYGLLKAEDPGVRFRNVKISTSKWVRGEMVVTDAVSDGATSKQQMDVVHFRGRILPTDENLLKKRVGGVALQVEEENVFLQGSGIAGHVDRPVLAGHFPGHALVGRRQFAAHLRPFPAQALCRAATWKRPSRTWPASMRPWPSCARSSTS